MQNATTVNTLKVIPEILRVRSIQRRSAEEVSDVPLDFQEVFVEVDQRRYELGKLDGSRRDSCLTQLVNDQVVQVESV